MARKEGLAPLPEDPFHLAASGVLGKFKIRLGEANLSNAYTGGVLNVGMNRNTRANIDLSLAHPAIRTADFSSQLTVDEAHTGARRFTGKVTSVAAAGEGIRIEAEPLPQLNDRTIGAWVYRIPAKEAIYTLARGGGLTADKIDIEGLDSLPYETFEIASPVEGIEVSNPIRVGNIAIVPRSAIGPLLEGYDVSSPPASTFADFSAYAVAYESANLLIDAERTAMAVIDTSLAWLLVRTRYSYAQLPNGEVNHWTRRSLHFRPRRIPMAAMRGLRSKRSWIRDLIDPATTRTMHIGHDAAELKPSLNRSLRAGLDQALIATARAILSESPVLQITALWEAIEFYVGGTRVPNTFSQSELSEIRKKLRGMFTGEKKRRVEDMIGYLNDAPTMAKFRFRLAQDGIPISPEEVETLVSLRRIRNDVVHGRAAGLPVLEHLNQGIAIVARIITYAMGGRF
ncbi:hypothetical protein [Dactylosporangium sp. NPDC049140]|uniref:hypothetical protein n=1 Tax=Dactylosporangium sp. NPDC049140 TaxID=3155647 RepID=UPI0033FE8E69